MAWEVERMGVGFDGGGIVIVIKFWPMFILLK